MATDIDTAADAHMTDIANGDMPSTSSARAQLLHDSFLKFLSHALREPAMQDMEACFPGLPQPVVMALHDLYTQVLAHVQEHAQAEFADVCQEYSIDAKLAELEQQVQKAQQATDADALLGAAKAAEARARLTAKQQETQHLESQLQQVTGARDQLRQKAVQKRVEVDKLVQSYAQAADDVCQVYDSNKAWRQALTTDDKENDS